MLKWSAMTCSTVASAKTVAASRATGDVTIHTLRYTALSRMIEAGYDDYTVMEISGHSSTRMLARYTHPTDARKQEALESFSVVTNWSQRPGTDHSACPNSTMTCLQVLTCHGLWLVDRMSITFPS